MRITKHGPEYDALHYVLDHDTPSDILAELVNSKGVQIRIYLAMNRNTPPAAHMVLAKDAVADVRYEVAANYRSPPAALTILAEDGHEDIVYAVSRNPNTPPLVKMWLETYRDSGMSLVQFLEVANVG